MELTLAFKAIVAKNSGPTPFEIGTSKNPVGSGPSGKSGRIAMSKAVLFLSRKI
jgi:hypothetical protein